MNKILSFAALLLVVGVGCESSAPTGSVQQISSETPAVESTEPVQPQSEQAAAQDTEQRATRKVVPVEFTSATLSDAEIDALVAERNAGKRPYNMGVSKLKIGETVNWGEGCSMNPTYDNHYTLKSVEVVNGKWVITMEEYGPLNIETHSDDKDSWQIEFAKTKPSVKQIVLSQKDEVDFDHQEKNSGAIYASNGAYVPIFVSKDLVYFSFTVLSC